MRSTPEGRFRAALCLSTAAMMAVSWPLWVSGGLFPRVPFVGGLRALPVAASWARYGGTLVAMLLAGVGARPKTGLVVAVVASAWMVLEDQFRLQPWMYQFLLMGLALAACPASQAMALCRLFLVAMYFHSGLSKLDGAFAHGPGTTFLNSAGRSLGFSPRGWSEPVRTAAIFAMPTWEILVAVGLAVRKTRRVAIAGAVAQHIALLVILGPAGLRHSTNVLLWNVAIAVEVILLFGRPGFQPHDEAPASAASSLARSLFVLAAVLPFGERAGLWDPWPSFALYSGHDERVDFLATAEDLDAYPEEIRRHFHDVGTYHLLYVNEWSLEARGTPAYPGSRALNGVAEALASRYRGPRPARVIHAGRAATANGERTRRELLGLDQIRRHGDTYRLNARPSP